MEGYSRFTDQLNEYERIMESYYRCDPFEKCNALSEQAANSFNEWVKTSAAELDMGRAALERQLEPLRAIEAQANSISERLHNEKPDPPDPAAVKAYNLLVTEFNQLVQRHKELFHACQQSEKSYNERINEHNQEASRRRQQAEAVDKDAVEQFNAYRHWLEGRGPEKFFKELNISYAALMQEVKQAAESFPELHQYINRIRKLRSELGAYAQKNQESIEDGIMVVEVTVCREAAEYESEQCYMFVDSGASVVSIQPELVEAIGLTEHVGDEVEIYLPRGISIKAPQLVIPEMSVQGMKAEYVKAIVLRETQPGVDGCIGLSFLNRLNYHIKKEGPQRLLPGKKNEPQEPPAFDVFISHRSEDFSDAKKVFDLLNASGYHPFLSEISLLGRGDADFRNGRIYRLLLFIGAKPVLQLRNFAR
ncbi:MAG TPA: retroviral-like aspartic protease family protein [Pyrinomonadaceae bacterium]|nr:retroviral-like aspartic protease family protein [Pyrinomonadaceae bacterium]